MGTATQAFDTSLHVATVTLAVRDLTRVAAFYRDVIGLTELARMAGRSTLGIDGRSLLELVHRPSAQIGASGGVGLFHTAFLLPTRADLGRWLIHAGERGVLLDGASDHGVSEAVYLADPEGNGIEIYADRSRMDWPMAEDGLRMPTRRLAVPGVIAAAADGRRWSGAPSGTSIGHIHLAVGSVSESEAFYRDVIGLDRMVRLPEASFLSSGGYHHHVAINSWRTSGASARGSGLTGLEGFQLASADDAVVNRIGASATRADAPIQLGVSTILLTDPSGIRVAIGRTA